MGDEETAPTVYAYLDGHRESSAWCSRAGLAHVTYPNGETFTGRFNSKREREGRGKYVYVDEEGRKSSYEGDWRASVKHGFGVLKYANGDTYEGMWNEGVRHGQGTLRYANGDVFSGEWVNDIKEGQGAYVFASPESQLAGLWRNGELVRGKWITPDQTSFHGEFADGKPIRTGVFYHRHGLTQEGSFLVDGADAEEGEAAPEDDGETEPKPRKFRGGFISLALDGSPELAFSDKPAGKASRGAAIADDDFVVVTKSDKPPKEEKEDAKEGPADVSAEVAEEKSALERLFESVDGNEDGQIALHELIGALSAAEEEKYLVLTRAAPQMSNTDYHEFFKEVDTDGNGFLSLDEFNEYFYILKLFNFVDADGSGKVRHGELRSALAEHPEVFPPEFGEAGTSRIAISALMSAGDLDFDRLLTFREFVHMIFKVQDSLDSCRKEDDALDASIAEAKES